MSDFVPEALRAIVERRALVVRGTAQRWAVFSLCERYRYALVTEVNPEGEGDGGFCGLNPSDATHEVNDNTHTRCMEFTRLWGYRRNWMLNAFAVRDKNPKVLRRVDDPVGPANNDVLIFAASHLKQIVAAWGAHASFMARGARVRRELLAAGANLRAFRFNADGSPEHPLYMPYAVEPQAWT